MTTPLKIIDIIDHKNKYSTQRFVVINRKLNFLYERNGKWLIAEDSGFFSFYKYERPIGSFYAFAGRQFDILLKDGSIERAYGQWWDGVPEDYRKLVSHIGYNTPDGLAKCNVFYSGNVDPVLIDEWLSKNTASNNYYKYNTGHQDYGKHTIVSPWE